MLFFILYIYYSKLFRISQASAREIGISKSTHKRALFFSLLCQWKKGIFPLLTLAISTLKFQFINASNTQKAPKMAQN
jgi:hypothetical protein